jgi:hypothetical protein
VLDLPSHSSSSSGTGRSLRAQAFELLERSRRCWS